MKMRTMTILLVAATLPLAGCTKRHVADPTTAQGEPVRVTQFGSFAKWDSNGDGELTRQEFEQQLTEKGMYNDLDADGDGEITDLEFRTALYDAWDIDGDEIVDVYEYRWGQGAWFADNTMFGSFEDWDEDGDEELTLKEFNEQTLSPVTVGWDLDENGELTDLEFQQGLWNAWDLDGDEVVDVYEYREEEQGS